MKIQWQLELSERRVNDEWTNARHVGESLKTLDDTLADLKVYVDGYQRWGSEMNSPAFLKAVLRVERKLLGSSLGLSEAPTMLTPKEEAKAKK